MSDPEAEAKGRIRALPLWRGAVTLMPLSGGLSNRNFEAHDDAGAYVVREPERRRDVTLIASGSEVSVAFDAARLLAEDGVEAAVVSAPCFDLFRSQPHGYRQMVLGDAPRVGVEAAVEGDWMRWLGDDGEFVGFSGVGWAEPGVRHLALGADGFFGVGEPLGVIEGEAGDGEEEDDGEGGHREVDMQPAGDDGGFAAQVGLEGGRFARRALGGGGHALWLYEIRRPQILRLRCAPLRMTLTSIWVES